LRKLASIQVIKDHKPIPNADRIETATIIDDNGFGGMVGNRVSFKAINPEFLLKWKL
jgi:hypothetical protein